MPRNVRNFWIEGSTDGRASAIKGGPVSKDGGIDLTIYQRTAGDVMKAASIYGIARSDGTLALVIEANHERIEIVTVR